MAVNANTVTESTLNMGWLSRPDGFSSNWKSVIDLKMVSFGQDELQN